MSLDKKSRSPNKLKPTSGEESLSADSDLGIIAGLISDLPVEEPPRELLTGVMARVKPHKLTRGQRFGRWLRSPKSITFTPLRLASTAAAMILVLALGAALIIPSGPENLRLAETEADEPDGRTTMVTFQLKMPVEAKVALIGTFNNWSPEGYAMTWDEKNQVWTISAPLERGRHEYAFLVNGQRVVPDPDAWLQRDDGFGNKNSVLFVGDQASDEKVL